ncbi:MAG: peptidoglycan DD-metalloendopeptidase family protein [Cytophagales bacterium]|nr:peptidoglycan DD-metalloendopeptidase family protein [Bernardetiaceae bacterium]MDW8205368.1 peptidoglycan DD-metalloendopeptidase family protein [Cytophagales bacterium]
MAKIKYYYDTETCRYEELKRTPSEVLINIAGFVILASLSGLLFSYLARTYFPSASEAALQEENQQLLLKYELLSKQMKEVDAVLAKLQERDDKIYRLLFEAEPIADEIRKGGVGGAEKYRNLLDEGLKREQLIISSFKKLDQLKRQMYVQSKSYDEIVKMQAEREKRLASMPAIRPVADNDLTMFISGYGMRMHPIYKVRKFHSGCDFAAPTGTPVYATGEGIVRMADYDGGYGKCIEIDHGFGFVTKYAHLSAYTVKVGQRVKRGQMIGRVGSTGTSVSPHLHYEVIKNGQKVNPLGYFFNDLTPEQYTKMLEIAAQDRPSLGGN